MTLLDPVKAVLQVRTRVMWRQRTARLTLTWTTTPNNTTTPATAASGFMARISGNKVTRDLKHFIITKFAVHIRDLVTKIIWSRDHLFY